MGDSRTGRELRSFRVEEPPSAEGRIRGAAFSRNRLWMLAWGAKSVQLWDVPGGRRVQKWEDGSPWRGAAFLFEDPNHRKARGKQRGLGVFGEDKIAFRPLEH